MAKQKELPEMEGTGVELVQIAELDDLIADYVKERDKRMKLTPREVSAKERVLTEMHKHETKLKQPNGHLVYRYDGQKITALPGKEKLQVRREIADEIEVD